MDDDDGRRRRRRTMDDERRRRCGRGVAVGVAKQTNVDFRSSNFCGRIFGALIFDFRFSIFALFDFLTF